MFDKIPKSRLFIYLMVIGALPILFAIFILQNRMNEVEILKEKIRHVSELTKDYEKRQSVNIKVMNHYLEADHFYIDKYLETLVFLEPEIEALQKIASHKNFPGDPNIKRRLELLTGSQNSLNFTEGVVQSFPFYQETMETLTHPVELNTQDLKNLLSKVEGIPIGAFHPQINRPQLIVLDFKLDKKKHNDGNETFILDMKLLKREFL